MEMRRDVFQAIADPNRRAIIHLLSTRPLTLNGVAENFGISRPAISRHIRILTECGLVVIRQQGRERYCQPNFAALGEVSDWVSQYKSFWTAKLDALGQFLETQASAPRQNASTGKSGATGKGSTTGRGSAMGKGSAAGKSGAAGKASTAGKSSAAGKSGATGKGSTTGRDSAMGKGSAAGKGNLTGKTALTEKKAAAAADKKDKSKSNTKKP